MPAPVTRNITELARLDDVQGPFIEGEVIAYSSGKFQSMANSGNDLNYLHTQNSASTTWVVVHNLGKHPSVTVVDSAGTQVEMSIHYDSLSQVTLTATAPFSGLAYFN